MSVEDQSRAGDYSEEDGEEQAPQVVSHQIITNLQKDDKEAAKDKRMQ